MADGRRSYRAMKLRAISTTARIVPSEHSTRADRKTFSRCGSAHCVEVQLYIYESRELEDLENPNGCAFADPTERCAGETFARREDGVGGGDAAGAGCLPASNANRMGKQGLRDYFRDGGPPSPRSDRHGPVAG